VGWLNLLERSVDRFRDITQVAGDAVAERFAPTLTRLRELLAAERRGLDQLSRRPLREQQAVLGDGALRRKLIGYKESFNLLQRLIEQRLNPRLNRLLADADALAADCLAPLRTFFVALDADTQLGEPFCYFQWQERDRHGKLNDLGIAVIGMPKGYEEEIWAWPAVGHEIGHLLLHGVPGLHEEVLRVLQLDPQTLKGERNNIYSLFSFWVEELIADALGAMLLGSAFASSMLELLRRTERSSEVIQARPGPGGLDPHPPRQLRVFHVLRHLELMGLDRQAAEIREHWGADFDPFGKVMLSFENGQRILVPAAPISEATTRFAEQLAYGRYQSLGGYQLRSIPGFNLGVADQAHIESLAKLLAQGRLVRAPARHLVSAAAVALLEQHAPREQVEAAARGSIPGLGTGERAVVSFPGAMPGGLRTTAGRIPLVGNYSLPEIRDALILAEVLGPAPG
jgi:hypothetical protein